MTIAFGQGALNGTSFSSSACTLLSCLIALPGELGHGPDQPKSATKPIQNMPLSGIDVIQYVVLLGKEAGLAHAFHRIAAGQNTTFILAQPNEKFSELPRHPADIAAPDLCVVCNRDNGDDDAPLECDKVSLRP